MKVEDKGYGNVLYSFDDPYLRKRDMIQILSQHLDDFDIGIISNFGVCWYSLAVERVFYDADHKRLMLEESAFHPKGEKMQEDYRIIKKRGSGRDTEIHYNNGMVCSIYPNVSGGWRSFYKKAFSPWTAKDVIDALSQIPAPAKMPIEIYIGDRYQIGGINVNQKKGIVEIKNR